MSRKKVQTILRLIVKWSTLGRPFPAPYNWIFTGQVFQMSAQ